MNNRVKDLLNPTVRKAMGTVYDYFCRLPYVPSAYLHPLRRESIRKLKKTKGIYSGERCFLIGNGPSLLRTDLSKLSGEYSFGFNRIFLAKDELNFIPSCLVSINDLVIEQSVDELNALKIPKFFSWRSRKWIKMDENTHFLYTSYTGPGFSKNITGRVWEGATVTNVALQLAYYMGFSTVILVGVDHNFSTKGKPNTTITSTGDDPNHFSAAYFSKGFRWQLPDLETSEIGYRLAREAYEKDNRQVLDATIDGNLDIFLKVDYESLFN